MADIKNSTEEKKRLKRTTTRKTRKKLKKELEKRNKEKVKRKSSHQNKVHSTPQKVKQPVVSKVVGEWFLMFKNGRRKGPYSFNELITAIKEIKDNNAVRIRKSDSDKWVAWVNAIKEYPFSAHTDEINATTTKADIKSKKISSKSKTNTKNEVFDKQSTLLEAETQPPTSSGSQKNGVLMSFWKRLFGKRPANENTQSTTHTTGGSFSSRSRSDQWRQFFNIIDMEESSADALQSFVGKWPEDVDPGVFSSIDMTTFLRRIRDYQKMKYPLRSPYFNSADLPRPTYKMVDGKIGRASSMIDMIFMEVVPLNVKKMSKLNEQIEPAQIAWRLIEYYSEFPLAKLIFLLPFMSSASEAAKKGDQAVIVVIEDALMQVHKGIENVLFDVYNDIPEGGLFNDKVITTKLHSFLDVYKTRQAGAKSDNKLPEVSIKKDEDSRSLLDQLSKTGGSTTTLNKSEEKIWWLLPEDEEKQGPFTLSELKIVLLSSEKGMSIRHANSDKWVKYVNADTAFSEIKIVKNSIEYQDKAWWIQHGKQKTGPYTMHELNILCKSKHQFSSVYIRRGDSGTFVEYNKADTRYPNFNKNTDSKYFGLLKKEPCSKCGAMILLTTAEKTGGCCMPCSKIGDTQQEAGADEGAMSATTNFNNLFHGVPIEIPSVCDDAATSLKNRFQDVFPDGEIMSTTVISSRYPTTEAGAVNYFSLGGACGVVRLDREDKEYRDINSALKDGRVWLTIKTYKYPSYPLIQFIARIYKGNSKKPVWWAETLGDISHGDIRDFITDACRKRKWRFVMSRYNPSGEQELDEMIELHERVFTLSEHDINRFQKETEIATQHFLKIPKSQRDFTAAAHKLMKDDPPVEGI